MRYLLVLLLLAPVFTNAQINRSANELACERVKEYIETKLFSNLHYKAIAYGELKAYQHAQSQIAWTIEHKFEIESPVYADKKTLVTKLYRFSFSLDKRLKVLKAESYMLE